MLLFCHDCASVTYTSTHLYVSKDQKKIVCDGLQMELTQKGKGSSEAENNPLAT